MPFLIAVFAVIGCLLASAPSHAQTTSSTSSAPKQSTAPVGHRQPRPSDLSGSSVGSTPPPPAETPPPAHWRAYLPVVRPDRGRQTAWRFWRREMKRTPAGRDRGPLGRTPGEGRNVIRHRVNERAIPRFRAA